MFEPLDHCIICGKATYFTQDSDGNWYCEADGGSIPEDKLTWAHKQLRIVERYWRDLADLARHAPEQASRQLENDLTEALERLADGTGEEHVAGWVNKVTG